MPSLSPMRSRQESSKSVAFISRLERAFAAWEALRLSRSFIDAILRSVAYDRNLPFLNLTPIAQSKQIDEATFST